MADTTPLSGATASTPLSSQKPQTPARPLDDSDQRLQDFQTKNKELTDRANAVSQDTQRKNLALEKGLEAQKPPQFQQVPYADPKKSTPQEEWGSIAMVFAMLGSAFTRNKAVTALNAGAAVMNAYKQNNKEAADHAYRVWEIANKNAMEAANYQQGTYKSIVSQYERRMQINNQMGAAEERAIMAQINANANAFRDTTMLRVGQERGLQGMINEQNRREKELKQMEASSGKIEKEKALHDLAQSPEYQDAVKRKDWDAITEMVTKVDPEQGLKLHAQIHKNAYAQQFDKNDPAFEAEAKAIAEGRQAPYTGFNMRIPKNQALMQRVREINPEYDARKYQTSQAAIRSFGTGKQGDTVRSLIVVEQHLKTLEELGSALAQGDTPRFNAIANRYRQETGSGPIAGWEAAKEIVGTEIAKAVSGSGAGALADREHIKSVLDSAQSPAQRSAAIQSFKDLIRGQMRGLREQYSHATGLKDFDEKIPEDVRNYFGIEGAPSGNATPASGGAAPAPAGAPAPAPTPVPTPAPGGSPAPNTQQQAPSTSREADYNGRRIVVKDGKWVYKDSGEAVH